MIRKHADAIGHAMEGLLWAVRTQPNYRAHLFLIGVSILGGIAFTITSREWQIIAVMSMVGLIIETLNTAIEKLGDAVDRSYNADIKIAKDVSAAAMLLFATGALVVACIIFVPKIIALIV